MRNRYEIILILLAYGRRIIDKIEQSVDNLVQLCFNCIGIKYENLDQASTIDNSKTVS